MKRFNYLILALFSLSFIEVKGQNKIVALGKITEDSLRISINEIIKNPVVSITDVHEYQLISFDLILNINGVIHSWKNLKTTTLDSEKINLLKEVDDEQPRYNQLFIENVKYKEGEKFFERKDGIYLWLAQETDCSGKYNITEKRFKRKWGIRFEYFYCDGSLFMTKEYDKRGNLRKIQEE